MQNNQIEQLKNIIKKSSIFKFMNIAFYWLYTSLLSNINENEIVELKSSCIFIGHGRSGHSIVGALLDAHPNVILSDETDILKYLGGGMNKLQICKILIRRSKIQAKNRRIKHGSYSYWVPNQWQGRYSKLLVIGDSKASVTLQKLNKDPNLLIKLKNVMKTDLKFIQVLRNPFDNISSICIREGKRLNEAIPDYFENYDRSLGFSKYLTKKELCVVYHEDLISNPKLFLISLLTYLNIIPNSQYLDECASIIFDSPYRTRNKIKWSSEQINIVNQQISNYHKLVRYNYEN